MLNKKFKHHSWFKGSTMTVKEFLDYVLKHSGDFIIKIKNVLQTNNLFDKPILIYYLSDRRCSYKLNSKEARYLAEHDDYFKSKLL